MQTDLNGEEIKREVFVNEDSASMLTKSKLKYAREHYPLAFKESKLTKKMFAVLRQVQKNRKKGISRARIVKNLHFNSYESTDTYLAILILKGYIYRKRTEPKSKSFDKFDFDDLDLFARYKYYAREFAEGDVEFNMPVWWNNV